jgi:dephospho-CoA kinase
MIMIALTGSIGMGKSTVAAMFAAAGIPVFDADAEVHRLQAKDGPLIAPIDARFPGVVTDGVLDRAALAARVLTDPAELAALEEIVHPAVQQAREKFVAEHAKAPALLFDIPLLFETVGDKEFDKIIVVSAPADIQRERVLRRDNMTQAKLYAVIARQLPDAEKRARADWVVDTSGSLDETRRQVAAIVACLNGSGAR